MKIARISRFHSTGQQMISVNAGQISTAIVPVTTVLEEIIRQYSSIAKLSISRGWQNIALS